LWLLFQSREQAHAMSQPTPAEAGNAPNSPAPNDHHAEDEMDVDGDMGVDLSPQKRSKRKLNDAGTEEVDQSPSNASNQTSSDTMQVDHHPNDDSAVNHVAKKAKLHENPPNAAAELPRIHLPTGHSRYQIYIATDAGSVFFGNQDASAVQIRYCVPFVSTADSFTVGNLKQLVSHKYGMYLLYPFHSPKLFQMHFEALQIEFLIFRSLASH
jgi:hypothetical protein